ncbi:MAG TPA: FkbM family methyltransferase [Methanomicrobiales archaeon]|nr:FkbM family methyltransferase [Methanomicrobiales archaeon]
MWRELCRRTEKGLPPAGGPKSPDEKTHPVIFASRDLPYRQITDVSEYRFDDIRGDDIVVDIGANAGAFSLRAARYSDHIVAVEPVTWEILEENVRLNQAPVRVIRGALGDGNPASVSWDGCGGTVPTFTLGQIKGNARGCDFLKCDCEGGEWLIRPEELSGIRRIEMEIHLPPIGGPPNPGLLDYIGKYYDFEIVRIPTHDVMGVMGVMHAVRRDG